MGKGPSQILLEMGYNPEILGNKRKESIVQRMKQYELRADGQAGGLGLQATPSEKFRLIKEMTERDNNLLNITWLCDTADVSRSAAV